MSRYTMGGVTMQAVARRDASRSGTFVVTLDDRSIEVQADRDPDGRWRIVMPDGSHHVGVVSRAGASRWVQASSSAFRAEEATGAAGGSAEESGLEAPMPGKVWKVLVAPGDAVEAGQTLLIIEAMKMEHAIKAPRDGVVREVLAAEEDMVEPGKALVALDEVPAEEAG